MNANRVVLSLIPAAILTGCGAQEGDWDLGGIRQELVSAPRGSGTVLFGTNAGSGSPLYQRCTDNDSSQYCIYPASNNFETNSIMVSYGALPSAMRTQVNLIAGGWNGRVTPQAGYKQLSLYTQSAPGPGHGEIRYELVSKPEDWGQSQKCTSMRHYVRPVYDSCNGVTALTEDSPYPGTFAQCNLIRVEVNSTLRTYCPTYLSLFYGGTQAQWGTALDWQIPAHGLAMAIGLGKNMGVFPSQPPEWDPQRDAVVPRAHSTTPGWLSPEATCLLGKATLSRGVDAVPPAIDPLFQQKTGSAGACE